MSRKNNGKNFVKSGQMRRAAKRGRRSGKSNEKRTKPVKETWRDVYFGEKPKKSPLQQLPPHLRGESNNKYGGHQAQSMKTYETDWNKTYECRSLSPEDVKELEFRYNLAPKASSKGDFLLRDKYDRLALDDKHVPNDEQKRQSIQQKESQMNHQDNTTGPAELSHFLKWAKDFILKRTSKPTPDSLHVYCMHCEYPCVDLLFVAIVDKAYVAEGAGPATDGWKELGVLNKITAREIDALARQLPAIFSIAQEWDDELAFGNFTVSVRTSAEVDNVHTFWDCQELSLYAWPWETLINGGEEMVEALFPRCPERIRRGKAFYPYAFVFPRKKADSASAATLEKESV